MSFAIIETGGKQYKVTASKILEIEKLKIIVNDNSLRKIIKNDELFIKDDKFSRTEYEKFLITSGVTAPTFETNIAEQEKKRQFLSSLSGGIVVPEILVNKEYRKENQTKTIRYIDLEKFHSKYKPTDEDKNELEYIKAITQTRLLSEGAEDLEENEKKIVWIER